MSKGTRERLNKLIRSRIPGGNQLLDALPVLRSEAENPRRDRSPEEVLAIERAYRSLLALVDRLRDDCLPLDRAGAADRIAQSRDRRQAETPNEKSRMPYDDDDGGRLSTRSVQALPPVQSQVQAPAESPTAHHAGADNPRVRHFASELPDRGVRKHTGMGIAWTPPSDIVQRMGKETDAAIAAAAGVSETAVREARGRLEIAAFRPGWTEADDKIVKALPPAEAVSLLPGRTLAAVKTRRTRLIGGKP